MSPRTALRVRSLAPIVTAVCLVTLPAAALAQASKGAGEVVEGAKKIGKGVEETAKGIGKTVSEARRKSATGPPTPAGDQACGRQDARQRQGLRRIGLGRDEVCRPLHQAVLHRQLAPPRPAAQMSRRPSSARDSVTSSAYSRSPPTGSPRAMRVTWSPSGRSSLAR